MLVIILHDLTSCSSVFTKYVPFALIFSITLRRSLVVSVFVFLFIISRNGSYFPKCSLLIRLVDKDEFYYMRSKN